MKKIFSVLLFLITISIVIALNTKIGKIPPLGKFLNPFNGFWQNAEGKMLSGEEEISIPGLTSDVHVVYDSLAVPHIFAKNTSDLYRVQGYVTAAHRLWQMEFQTHAAAGRVSEVVGEVALEYDRFQRRIGMMYAAEKSLAEMMKNPETKSAVEAYTEGVNAYINQLSPKEYPVEYKLLDYAPEEWTPLKCALLLKYMAWDLSGNSSDLALTNVLRQLGPEMTEKLFPSYPKIIDPVIPTGTEWDFEPLAIPHAPQGSDSITGAPLFPNQPDDDNGSNNWVLGAERSASGYPILANDPHLSLNLPSLWYQIQLKTPDMNVCGASLPGAPGVVIGFNEKIAWGVTNVDPDVLDWYKITFTTNEKKAYEYNGGRRKTDVRIEKIKVRGKDTVTDTVIYTHHGPVALKEGEKGFSTQTPVGYAMRWLAHDASDEWQTFYKLNKAQNYEDYVDALSTYACPAQNFAYADSEKNIALWVNGKFPLKYKNQGKYLLDGSAPEQEWQDFIPHSHNPHVKNPPRGFVSSANQYSVDSTYPYYLNWEFGSFERGSRINQQLSLMNNAGVEEMSALQSDNYNLLASIALPILIKNSDLSKLTSVEKELFNKVSEWNYKNDPGEVGPVIFNAWKKELNQLTWGDNIGGENVRYPSVETTLTILINDSLSNWYDNRMTEETESREAVITSSFKQAAAQLMTEYNTPSSIPVWSKYKNIEIRHLARIPGFNRAGIYAGGGAGIVNALKKTHGPSWRMVVQLGPEVKAYGIYPGGQSGNPGSPYYDNFIDKWSKGELNEIIFMKSPDEYSDKNKRVINFKTK